MSSDDSIMSDDRPVCSDRMKKDEALSFHFCRVIYSLSDLYGPQTHWKIAAALLESLSWLIFKAWITPDRHDLVESFSTWKIIYHIFWFIGSVILFLGIHGLISQTTYGFNSPQGNHFVSLFQTVASQVEEILKNSEEKTDKDEKMKKPKRKKIDVSALKTTLSLRSFYSSSTVESFDKKAIKIFILSVGSMIAQKGVFRPFFFISSRASMMTPMIPATLLVHHLIHSKAEAERKMTAAKCESNYTIRFRDMFFHHPETITAEMRNSPTYSNGYGFDGYALILLALTTLTLLYQVLIVSFISLWPFMFVVPCVISLHLGSTLSDDGETSNLEFLGPLIYPGSVLGYVIIGIENVMRE
eukprot:gnl/Dysnectes_brevis/2638_a3189_1652.p1 GENE.gnl/Dysnectes_brevis/2638_a3189_1652~~gnl/Dysnectes_brevis/2638_a3189_1652.p1  ORF type:complete len:392 (+),score=-15.79 gnl/Dysnectes_brevis/2638_a3189_1652:106-1176(+)